MSKETRDARRRRKMDAAIERFIDGRTIPLNDVMAIAPHNSNASLLEIDFVESTSAISKRRQPLLIAIPKALLLFLITSTQSLIKSIVKRFKHRK